MSLFTRKSEPEDKPAGGGKNVLRGAVKNYNRSPAAIGRLNSELQVSTGTLQAFEAGADNLTIEQLSGLTKWFFFNAEYDAEADLLRSKGGPATPLGVAGPPAKGRSIEEIIGPAERLGLGWLPVGHGPQPAKDPLPAKASSARPGWA